jgi:hypothetical protein
MGFWKYSIGGTFEEYPVPEFTSRESADWNQELRDAGFEHMDTLGTEEYGARLEMIIWRHDKHGYLVEVGFTFCYGIIQVICPNPPTLLCFLRDFAPLLQAVTISEQIGPLVERTLETIFHPTLGVEPVVNVEQQRKLDEARRDRMFPKAKG